MVTVKVTAVAAVVVATEVARVLSGDSSSYTGGCSNNSGSVCWIVSDCCLSKDFDRSEVKFSEQKSRF